MNIDPSPRRRATGRWCVTAGLGVAAVCAAAMAVWAQASPADRQAATRPQEQPPPQSRPAPPQVPIFRAGAAVVRVDAYVTRDGKPVTDLAATDFEVLEDGRPQTIETFERVTVRAGGAETTRVEPRTVEESRQAAADPRARIFIVFLDTGHVRWAGARQIRTPLARFLDGAIGQDDLVALMTPAMSASDITFTRRTGPMIALLDQHWGQLGTVDKDDPTEGAYAACYPPSLTVPLEDQLLGKLLMRRRARRTLDALWDLAVHLDGLREERKAVLVVSEGWALFGEDRTMVSSKPMPTGVYVGPDGRLRSGAPGEAGGEGMWRQCERDRMILSQFDFAREFRTFLDEANRANVSFYPVDPRGLPAFATDMGPYQPLDVARDAVKLTGQLESLRTLASATDGVPVMGSNDIEGGIRRIVDDLTSYYLMSYSSTNPKLDGRFRSIRVRVKRPGVEVRARRGYRAPTAEEVESRVKAVEAAAAVPTPLSTALGALAAFRPQALFRLATAAGWRGSRLTDGAVWLVGEFDARAAREEDWKAGGEVDINVAGDGEESIAAATVTMAPGTRSFSIMLPVDEPGFSPGDYVIRVRVKSASGGLPVTDTTKLTVSAAPDAVSRGTLGQPVLYRRGPATGQKYEATADPRFRRQERVRVDLPVAGALAAPEARLLSQQGQPLPLPIAVTERAEPRVRWMSAELALAPLAPGDFVIEITARSGERVETRLVAFRIVP